jgi:hypothetical protein
MKKWKSFVFASVVLAVSACDNEGSPDVIVDSDEAAEMVAAALSESSSGFTTVVAEAVTTTEEVVAEINGGRAKACGYSDTESFSVSNSPDAAVTYSYNYSYQYELTCGIGDEPQTMAADVTYSGDFDGPRLASDHAGMVAIEITALEEEADTYLIDGTYGSQGTFTSKMRNQNSTTSTISIGVDELVVIKADKEIMSGTASVTISGVATGKGEFSFDASIVFLGDRKATVVINGTDYEVNLTTGTIE